MEEKEIIERARKRMEDIKGFYMHLFVYIIINAFLIVLNLITSADSLWFIWPLLGWGIGLLVHFLSVFILDGFFGTDWEERKVRQIADKYKNR